MPDFNKLSDTEKEQVIRSIKNKWGNLKNDELIKTMETLQFIPNVYNESNVRKIQIILEVTSCFQQRFI